MRFAYFSSRLATAPSLRPERSIIMGAVSRFSLIRIVIGRLVRGPLLHAVRTPPIRRGASAVIPIIARNAIWSSPVSAPLAGAYVSKGEQDQGPLISTL